ncbi:MAG: rhodanese-like domain-containing protein [Clostridiales bacterium]|nr:rhodanese-like domain-containing protein [Clostridiales bacterium]
MIIKLNHAEAKKLLDGDKNLILVDVRTKEEFEESYIEGARLLSLDQIEERAGEVLPDKNRQVMVYCRSGKRSKAAAEILDNMGYKHIYDMGGLIDWPFELIM